MYADILHFTDGLFTHMNHKMIGKIITALSANLISYKHYRLFENQLSVQSLSIQYGFSITYISEVYFSLLSTNCEVDIKRH